MGNRSGLSCELTAQADSVRLYLLIQVAAVEGQREGSWIISTSKSHDKSNKNTEKDNLEYGNLVLKIS